MNKILHHFRVTWEEEGINNSESLVHNSEEKLVVSVFVSGISMDILKKIVFLLITKPDFRPWVFGRASYTVLFI